MQIPVGSTSEFQIKVRDDLGVPFDSLDGLSFTTQLNILEIAAPLQRPGSSEYVSASTAPLPDVPYCFFFSS